MPANEDHEESFLNEEYSTCSISTYFFEYVKGEELSPECVELIEKHLKECADCRAFFAVVCTMVRHPEYFLPDVPPRKGNA